MKRQMHFVFIIWKRLSCVKRKNQIYPILCIYLNERKEYFQLLLNDEVERLQIQGKLK